MSRESIALCRAGGHRGVSGGEKPFRLSPFEEIAAKVQERFING
jgi:hypothetical protein